MTINTIESVREKLKHFDDDKFVFDPEAHVYTYDGKIMYGTTSLLDKRFIKQFDSDYWSKKKAAERGVDQSVVLGEWDAKRDRSCDLGHMVHDYIENFYELNSTQLPPDEEAVERIEKWHAIYESRLNQLESIGSEIRVFSKMWNLAGMIDKLYLFQNAIIIGDWKTNKQIKTDKDFAFDKLLSPFDKYKANEINKYSLQLSIYALILEEADINVEYFFICHIPSKGDAQIYKLKDFRSELRTYFNHQLIVENIDFDVAKNPDKMDIIW